MPRPRNAGLGAALGLLLVALLSACGSTESSPTVNNGAVVTGGSTATLTAGARMTPTAASLKTAEASTAPDQAAAYAGVPGIVDPANHGWPRQVEGLNGPVSIAAKPERILTVSLGHDEVTYALVPPARVVAVGSYTQDPEFSNVAHLATGVATIGREPEQIVTQNPDIVIAGPFTEPELVDALTNAGLTVLQTELSNDPEGRIQDILLMGYAFGEEERALELASEVRERHAALTALSQDMPGDTRPRVLALTSYSGAIYTAGSDSTEGSIIETAGGANAAAEAGLTGNPVTSLEGVIAMAPDLIVIPQAQGGPEFIQELLGNPALAEVPAIKEGRVYQVPSKLFTTLSFWNIRGAEELAKLLWPEQLGQQEFAPFSFPGQ